MSKQKVLIEVIGGMIQNITSTSAEVEINVFDADMANDPDYKDEKDAGWQYWKSQSDRIVNNKGFELEILKLTK